MLFRKRFLDGICAGKIRLAFRRWRRPTVRHGGKLMTVVGELQIRSVDRVEIGSITTEEAGLAGYDSLEALLRELNRREDGEVYRIELGFLRADPRIALRNTVATGEDLITLKKKLERLNSGNKDKPWTVSLLELLSTNSGVRAADLCRLVDQEKMQFKQNVRKLKNLGLTESLGTGYRLSKRGSALLNTLRSATKKG